MATLLVVDDVLEVREYLRDLLVMNGYEVITATNGNEAVAMYTIMKSQIDIVITDILMPEKDGEEAILELRNLNPEVKIIAISGGGILNARDHLEIVEYLNVNYTFEKPIKKAELLQAIKILLDDK